MVYFIKEQLCSQGQRQKSFIRIVEAARFAECLKLSVESGVLRALIVKKEAPKAKVVRKVKKAAEAPKAADAE